MRRTSLPSAASSALSMACTVLSICSCSNAEPASKKALAAGKDSTVATQVKAQTPVSADTAVSATGRDSAATSQERQLVVYYFRTTYRCPSCFYIEEHTQSAVKEAFAKELGSGRMVLRTINVEDQGNEHFVEDYKLYTKSVVLSDVAGGRQTRWKNLEKVWPLIRNDEGFRSYIVEEVKAFLGA
jgi:thiol-disulfide isomerase/thioredoxin